MGNITDPSCDLLLTLWDEPLEHTSIEVRPEPRMTIFTVVVEAPECPRLEIPVHPILTGCA